MSAPKRSTETIKAADVSRDEDTDALVLTPGPWENAFPLAICVVFVALGGVLAVYGQAVGLACMVVFGIFGAVLVWKAARHREWRLVVKTHSFEIVTPLTRSELMFSEIAEFGVARMKGGSRLAWRFGAAKNGATKSGTANAALWDGIAPSDFGKSPKTLVRLLEERRAAAAQPAAPLASDAPADASKP